jgi:hypothetical protein
MLKRKIRGFRLAVLLGLALCVVTSVNNAFADPAATNIAPSATASTSYVSP